MVWTVAMGRHLLKPSERWEFASSVDELLDRGSAEGADEFVFEVSMAHEEPLRVRRSERVVDARCPHRTREVRGLGSVAQDGDRHVASPGTEDGEEPSDVGGAAHRHDGDALVLEFSATLARDRLNREAITQTFDEDNRLRGACQCLGLEVRKHAL